VGGAVAMAWTALDAAQNSQLRERVLSRLAA